MGLFLSVYKGGISGLAPFTLLLALLTSGCRAPQKPSERQARAEFQTIESRYRPTNAPIALPTLTEDSPLGDFLTVALFRQPRVEAAYYDWAASVERITVERSRPDPRLTFKTDIQDTIVSLIPGLMVDLPGPGKLTARADVAAAESNVRYHAYAAALLQAAYDTKRAAYQLRFLADKLAVNRGNLSLVNDLEVLARSQYEIGRVTLQDVLRAQMESDRLTTEIANLEDSRTPLMAQLRTALGFRSGEADPPIPRQLESTPLALNSDQLLNTALARNPRLQGMEAEIRLADAGIRLARKSRVPDFTAGLEVDAKAQPVMVTPQAGMTLPIWRDKLAAELAAAQATKRAATARLSGEQIQLAVDLADRLFSYREATRNLSLIRDRLLSKARMSIEVARTAYLSGKTDFLNLIEAQRTLLAIQLSEAEARTQRELSLAEISLMIVGQPPTNAPVLNPK